MAPFGLVIWRWTAFGADSTEGGHLMPLTPRGRWHKWREGQAARSRDPRSVRGAAPTSGRIGAITLHGRGQAVTKTVSLAQGRWRVVVQVAKNARLAGTGARGEHILVMALGESDHFEVIVNDVAASGTWTSQILMVHDPAALSLVGPMFALPGGRIQFEVQTAASSAAWSISVEPI